LAKQNNDVWEGSKEAIELGQPDVGIYTKQQAIDALSVLLWPWKQKLLQECYLPQLDARHRIKIL
jgi:hypothetical protein